MATRFDKALEFALRWEGGLSDDPDDRGGRTMQGVTQRVYDAWRKQRGLITQDVALIGKDELGAIYNEGYWLKGHSDQLRAELDLVQFDTGVNMGTNRAIKILQAAVGIRDDGVFGGGTQAACDACEPAGAVARYCAIREELYRSFAQKPGQAKFLKGWLNRLNDLRAAAGVPGFTRQRSGTIDFGDAAFIERIPDIQPDQAIDAW